MKSKSNANVSSVCIVSQLFYPVNQAMAVRLRYIADALISKEISTSIITSSASQNVDKYNTQCLLTPVASNRDQVYIRLIKELVFGMEVFIRVLLTRSDIFFISSPPFTIAFMAVLACKIKGTPYIFDVRDEYPEVYFTEGLIDPDYLIGRWLKSVEKWIYRNSYKTITVTKRIVKKLVIKSGDLNKIYLLRNGFAGNIKPVKTLSLNPFIVLFHGNMGKFQQPELICKVAQLCHNAKLPIEFWVYGWGNRSEIILEGQKSIPNLKHRGELTHQKMPEIITQASIGISFQGNTEISRNSFPSKVMEFIGTGIPVIVTPVSEAGDFVEKYGVGFQFEPDQAQLIFDCIKRLFENPEEMNAINKKALSVNTELSRKVLSERFVEAVLYSI
ncbi:MAG: glycosyltransferase family 4 protein [Salibacteraceae bacterium]